MHHYRLSEDIKQKAPNIDWRGLSGFRNVLVHDYLNGVDLERVWSAIANDLPELKKTAKFLLKTIDLRQKEDG
ncbi:DUF86 domain-containing protein [[Leptolyngbya] sp. PCC 7376]|uniref:HepT-like ribonuclease domain-containing protein n=1 Tax=[Leptolyngbya] sp. PCC 7376 TaxID=111781 RepID=UPI000688F22B|nr:HepT-like ribonuclease domain-containing protein [[Leptolyngbya] sp. PCC 7376]